MKIPHYTPFTDFRGWLGWRLRMLAGRVEPERPHVIGPLPTDDGTVGWMVLQGDTSLAGFRTDPTKRYPSQARASAEELNVALTRQIFPEREADRG